MVLLRLLECDLCCLLTDYPTHQLPKSLHLFDDKMVDVISLALCDHSSATLNLSKETGQPGVMQAHKELLLDE